MDAGDSRFRAPGQFAPAIILLAVRASKHVVIVAAKAHVVDKCLRIR